MNTKGVPVNWNGEHWDFYKALMMSLFEEEDLENIATGKAKPPDPTVTDTEKKDWKQNQAGHDQAPDPRLGFAGVGPARDAEGIRYRDVEDT